MYLWHDLYGGTVRSLMNKAKDSCLLCFQVTLNCELRCAEEREDLSSAAAKISAPLAHCFSTSEIFVLKIELFL